jgi:adenylosuccinate lyase
MPHKKNTIRTEQLEGMERLALGYEFAILANIKTWEERAIEQSSVERVAWPDLFHVTANSLKVLTGVISGLKVYPDNMLKELVASRGCYAASQAKEVLKELGGDKWSDVEEAYRIVQLAAFNVFEPNERAKHMRQNPESSFEMADGFLSAGQLDALESSYVHVRDLIMKGDLRVTEELEATSEQVERWNGILMEIFKTKENRVRWYEIFYPSVLLKHESILFKEILGE